MFRSALTQLSQLSVTGVGVNYDIDAVPDELSRGQLPVLLVLPVDNFDDDDRFGNERGDGLQTLGFSEGARTVTYALTHLLIVAPVSSGSGIRSHMPALVDLIDNYFAALKSEVTLDGNLLEPARVTVKPGIFQYGETDYYGCAFRHTWVVEA
jgi:hypothetical protein